MIALQDVTLRYGDRAVLERLSFTFPKKGIVALMGPSGIGKTSLLRLLCGLARPTSGRVLTDHRSIAVSFQEPRLIPWLDCEKNITFVLSGDNEGLKTANELLEALELGAYKNALPDALSGGMKQRVSLARALAARADLLLLDEPFSALDEALKLRVIPLIREANKDGLTVIVTHDKDEARALGATVLLLEGDPVTALSPQ